MMQSVSSGQNILIERTVLLLSVSVFASPCGSACTGVLGGIMLNKDVTHPKMKRKLINPRVSGSCE